MVTDSGCEYVFRYPNPLVAKSYHDFLSGQIQERDAIGHRQHQRDMQV